jgi:toxin ParE1/3/4
VTIYRVTPRAHDDLKNIGRYTKKRWGKSQRDSYLRNLEARFNWLTKNPRLGKHRTDITENFYSFPEGQHIVFYLISEKHIDIIGIPHKDMDIIGYFESH